MYISIEKTGFKYIIYIKARPFILCRLKNTNQNKDSKSVFIFY